MFMTASVKTAILIVLFSVVFVRADVARSAECDENPLVLYQSPVSFARNKAYVGRIAWAPSGSASSPTHVIKTCIRVRAPDEELQFIIGNAADKHQDSEEYMFVFVQVVRIQRAPQVPLPSFTRKLGWERDGVPLGIIDDRQIRGLTVSKFFDIQQKMTLESPGDSEIAADGARWHGKPVSGLYSSLSISEAAATQEIRKWMEDARAVLSNRLYRFQANSGGAAGVPFFVSTDQTQRIIVRTYSPNRSEFDRTVQIELVR